MPGPSLSINERIRRRDVIEALYIKGYTPLGVRGSMGSACERGHKLDGTNYHRWVRSEEEARDRGRDAYVPDISLYTGTATPAPGPTVMGADMRPTQAQSAHTRAQLLASEIHDLVTRSHFPLINPEAIVIDAAETRVFDAVAGEYRSRQSKPRTWLSDTLRVAPVPVADGRRFLFTAAQNDTELHAPFWRNLKAYAAFIGAEIVVGPFTYETTWWAESDPTSREYATELHDHLCFGQLEVGSNFIFAGEMNTLPTASQPISDLITYSRNRWAVFPHAKRQLKSVPSTDPTVQSHQVMTTGAVTRPKVIPRKAGVKSLFHQVIGAVLVEFDEDANPFARQITANEDGAFYDLDRYVANGTVTTGHRARAVVVADLHLRKLSNVNAMATFGFDMSGSGQRYRSSLIDVLKPEHVMLHDIFDHEARNHHNANDNGHAYEMHLRGRDSILNEIVEVGHFLEKAQVTSPEAQIVVVESNHDIGLDRYVREGRYRNDAPNLRLGLALEQQLLGQRQRLATALDLGQTPPRFSLLEAALTMTGAELDRVSWAYDGYSRLIDGIEVGHHGFRGVNGSKGTIQGFARTGRRMSVGDKHSPEINEGVYVAGAMNLNMGYNKGPSTWAVSHIVQYKDGHRSIITLQQGRWRAEKPRISVPAQTAA